jgi:hypothetical protein
VVAIVVVLLACGGGGFAATAGVRYAVGWATGNEDGPDRLVRPATGTAGNLVVTVERVRHTAHFTRLDVERRNVGDTPVSLPLFGFCTLTAQDGTTLEADPFRSRWSETIAADTLTRGTVTFRGRLSPETTRATLAFSQVFGPRGGSLTVRVQLRPPPP